MEDKAPIPTLPKLPWHQNLIAQFQDLNWHDTAFWPPLPKYVAYVLTSLVVLVGAWFFFLTSYDQELSEEQAKELRLQEEYKKKLGQAINLDTLKKQREQVQQYVTQLEKQLPSKAEMDALLSDINQAGIGRSLQFELFRPGQVNIKEYYAELPIAIRLTGKYHALGAFAADIADLSRIVTLNNIAITPAREGSVLTMEATAKTFRYLDPEEVAAQRKANSKAPANRSRQ